MEIYELFNESKNLSEVLIKMKLSDNVKNWNKVKELAKDVGFDINIYKERRKLYCLKCNKELKRGQKKFCSKSCSASYNNTGRIVTDETKNKIKNALQRKYPKKKHNKKIKIIKEKHIKYCNNCGDELKNEHKKFCSNQCIGEYKHKNSYQYFISHPEDFNRGNYSPQRFKDFLIKEQNGKCDICGCDNEWNGKNLIFVMDHIDGNASNNKRENLRLVCPNCDSQLPTFKSKNKNSTRRNYFREKIIREINTNKGDNIKAKEAGGAMC